MAPRPPLGENIHYRARLFLMLALAHNSHLASGFLFDFTATELRVPVLVVGIRVNNLF